ncbi:MAG TPA: glycine--tRNA ligase subunit beta, partial [Methylotenera sp.]|nr:glycine--tRNA ligase subunit beta [Methylotenera sp.]
MSQQNLLVELFVEELPPKALKHLDIVFKRELFNNLMQMDLVERVDVISVTSYATPRRLAVHIKNVLSVAPNKQIAQKLMPVNVGLDASGNAT